MLINFMLGAINFLFPKIKLKNNTFKHCTLPRTYHILFMRNLHKCDCSMHMWLMKVENWSHSVILVFFLYQSCENGQVRKVVKIACWIVRSHDFTILQHISNPNLTLQLGDVALWDRHANLHDRWNQRFLCVNSFPFCGAGSRPNWDQTPPVCDWNSNSEPLHDLSLYLNPLFGSLSLFLEP